MNTTNVKKPSNSLNINCVFSGIVDANILRIAKTKTLKHTTFTFTTIKTPAQVIHTSNSKGVFIVVKVKVSNTAMLHSYLRIALRNLYRNRLYALINIVGLGIGIAAVVWAYQTYRFSFSYDDFRPDRERIFRALVYRDGMEGEKGLCPSPVAMAAKQDFASIAEAVRWDSRGADIKGDQIEPFSQQVHFTDPAFFEFFNFPLVAGSNDLSDKNAVLLTEEMATKFFGKENPLGKTLVLFTGEKITLPLTVKGVLKNPPLNSTIRFNFITHFDNQKVSDTSFVQSDDWKWFLDAVFFKIQNPADAPRLAEDFEKYLPLQNAARKDWKVTGFALKSLSEMAGITEMSFNSLYQRPEDSATYGPFVLALLILFSACLNFANTTVARSNRRLREMGVRKVMGGTRGQLMRQMLLECAAIVVAAIGLSMLFNHWWLPIFNSMFDGITVGADYLHDTTLIVFLVITFIFTTLLAGAYPAFYVSRFNPARIFSGTVKFGGTNLFSRLLLGLQVVVSLITVISGMAFTQNAAFQKNYDYGYDRKNVMGVSVSDRNTYEAYRNAVQHLPGIEEVAGTLHHIGFGYRSMTAETEGEKRETNYMEVGDNYLNTMNLHIAAGRAFDPRMESDYENALLVSQKFAGQFGWKDEEALGKQVRIDTIAFTVVGLLQDFHSDNLFEPMEPVAMRLVRPDKYFRVIIRAKPGELTSTYDQAKAEWAKLFPLKPFRGFYQDEVAAEALQVTSSIATIFSWFAIVAMLLTATGLFALVSLTVLKKMKEIAVRKVMGARPRQIMALVNKGYIWIFLVAAVIGCYAGWFLTKLLMDLIFKINVGVEVRTMIFAVVALFLISALTVGFKVRQAVRTNPAEVLKAE